MPCGHHFGYHHGPYYALYACPVCGVPHAPAPHGPPWHYGWPRPWSYPAYPPPPLQPVTDEQIRNMVYDALRSDPRIPPEARITTEVSQGVVTLTGTVPDKWVKHAAGEDALNVPGVVDVDNRLTLARR